jgi:mono/diheme cytochrome c family protein
MKWLAGALVIAAAAMVVVAFTAGDDPPEPTPQPVAEAGPRDGLAVWTEQGCGSCHALEAADATGGIGPDLSLSLHGKPASYVKESIVAPSARAAAGYSVGMMPEDYASRIDPTDLDRLVTFLRESAR